MPTHGTGLELRINQTLLEDALAIWRHSTEDKSSYPANLASISTLAMFTFDAAWTLIQALNKLSFNNSPVFVATPFCFNSSLTNSNEYHKKLETISFSGVSGTVQFAKNVSNDRIGGAYYVLYNVQSTETTENEPYGHLKYEPVMKWFGTKDKWKKLTDSLTIDIVWPQDSKDVPSDHPTIRGKTRGGTLTLNFKS
ncbi:unnamed protein product [Rotaria sp. Silwood1]|nr:unnamed protein product [Rotaria sp. Silwood1]